MARGLFIALAAGFLIASASPMPGVAVEAVDDDRSTVSASALTADLPELARVVEEAFLLVEAGADMDDALQRVVQGASLLFNQGNLWLGLTPEQVEEICNSPGAFHGAISIISGAWVNACVPGEAFTNSFLPLVGVWFLAPLSQADIDDFAATIGGLVASDPDLAFVFSGLLGGIGAAAFGDPALRAELAAVNGPDGVLLASGGVSLTGASFNAFLVGDRTYSFSGAAVPSALCAGCFVGAGPTTNGGFGLASQGDLALLDLDGDLVLDPLDWSGVTVISGTGLGIVGDQATGESLAPLI
jgi:hypothetical protein